MRGSPGRGKFWVSAAVAVSACWWPVAASHTRKPPHPTAVAVEPGLSDRVESIREEGEDAAALVHLVLTVSPHVDVRWRPLVKGGNDVIRLTSPATTPSPSAASSAAGTGRGARAL